MRGAVRRAGACCGRRVRGSRRARARGRRSRRSHRDTRRPGEGEAGGATGSGFVLDRQGHVITNNHVVEDAAEGDGPIQRGIGALLVRADGDQILVAPIDREVLPSLPGQRHLLRTTDVPHQTRYALKDINRRIVVGLGEGAREHEDERHICPLQLDFIERCVRLWSNPGETVFTPFMGIGSEVVTAVRLGRKGHGIELKPSYWRQSVKNLREIDAERMQIDIFEAMA